MYLELSIHKIEEDCKFCCPTDCRTLCEFKKKFMANPIQDGFTFTTVMLQLRNMSSETLIFAESPPWISLVDTYGRSYSEQQVCEACGNFVCSCYGDTTKTKNIGQLKKDAEAKLFLFFPQLPFGTKVSKLHIETSILNGLALDQLGWGDIFDVEIKQTIKTSPTLMDFPMKLSLNDRRNDVRASKDTGTLEPYIKEHVEHVIDPQLQQYRLRQDLSKLPKVRITPIHEIERIRRDVFKEDAIEELDAEKVSDVSPVPRLLPRPKRNLWTAEDRKIFTLGEMMREHMGYCEECENFGPLLYTDGLLLCENCREPRYA
jgi:hypothetical protein